MYIYIYRVNPTIRLLGDGVHWQGFGLYIYMCIYTYIYMHIYTYKSYISICFYRNLNKSTGQPSLLLWTLR